MKRPVLSALALSGALVLSACGSATSDAGSTTAAGTASGSASASASAAGGSTGVGDTVSLADLSTRASAAIAAKKTGHLHMELSSGGTSEADLDYSGDSPAVSMTSTNEGRTVRMILVDKVFYVGSDELAAAAGGKSWIKFDPSGGGALTKLLGDQLDQMESSMKNPADQFESFGDVDAEVVSVDGGVTTYAVKVSKEQLKKAVTSKEGLPGWNEQMVAQVPADGISYEISLDSDDLPVTLTSKVGDGVLTITYSKWGEPVDVSAPAASEVGTFDLPTG